MAKKKTMALNSKNNKKKKDDVVKPREYLVENLPYKFTPSYIYHNGIWASILQLYVRPGSNRQMSYNDVIDFIPTTTLSDVEVYMFVDDVLINGDEKKKVIKQNASMNKMTLEDIEKTDGQKKTDDNSAKEMRRADIDDYDQYEYIIDSAEPLVVYRWSMMIAGPSQEAVDEQLDLINLKLNQRHEGAKWDVLPGEQLQRFTKMFDQIPTNRFEMTSTGSNYSGLQMAVNSGLKDDSGLPLGIDVLSLSRSTAYFDFVGSTQKQAIIALPNTSVINRFKKEGVNENPSVSSIAAQHAANQFTMEGHRVHHIVLNNFDYFESGRYYRPKEIETFFERYDVSKLTVNPLQGFGDIKDVATIYSRLQQKIVNIFDLMMNLEMTQSDRAIILKAVGQFYLDQELWRVDADIRPNLTRIVDIQDPQQYPTLGQLINKLSTLATRAARDNRIDKADKIETIESILDQALTTYTAILNRPTAITPSKAPQIYYQFNNIEELKLKQIQFINLIEYIIYTAEKNDVIIIHGFDQVQTIVSKMVQAAIEAAKKQGIKFIFAFDAIKSPESFHGKMNDLFEMKNLYYNDLDSDVDWSFIGKVLPEELDLIKSALNQELGLTVESNMLAKTNNQVLVHRHEGGVNNFVALDPVI